MDLTSVDLDRWQAAPGPPPEAIVAGPLAKAMIAPPAAPSAERLRFLTADGQTATALEQEALFGGNDLLETSFLDRCLVVRECIGRLRISSPKGRAYATGFLVAPGLLLTNHHVLPTLETGRGGTVEFGYRHDVAGQLPAVTDTFHLDPDAGYLSDRDLDYALVAVTARADTGQAIIDRGYLRLIPQTGKAEEGEFVTVIQHPDGDPLQIALRENQIIDLKEDQPFLWYKADTAHGSSGSPVFNDSLQLIALHASGRIERDDQGRYRLADGTWAASLTGLREKDVVWEANVGFRVSAICASLLAKAATERPPLTPVLEAAMRGGDVLSAAVARVAGKPLESESKFTEQPSMAEAPKLSIPAAAGASVVIPLQLRVTLEVGGAVAPVIEQVVGAASGLETESSSMRVPFIAGGLDERTGFNRRHLDPKKDTPSPKLTKDGEGVAAKLLSGKGQELKYRHFSIWMHRERRLALFTAANVDWRARKKVVDGKSTNRKALAGFPPDKVYLEQWAPDPRIDARHQLPDIFYTEDRKAFDKGHLVRRDDVCWGEHYEEIQMANGDTYHVTNCSPQIMRFNQSDDGEQNWGDLENHVQAATKKDVETAALFSGPIFDKADRWFEGKDDAGPVRVQIPSRFWKVVVVKGAKQPEAYGFILEQDVRSITEEEFYVSPEWIGALRPIAEIESALNGWISLAALKAFDQYAKVKASA